MSTTIMRRAMAKAACAKVKTERLSVMDPWGKKHACKVSWQATTSDVDAGLDNLDQTIVIWPSAAPAYLVVDQMGIVSLTAPPVEVRGDGTEVVTPIRVESIDELAPGCFFVDWDADEDD